MLAFLLVAHAEERRLQNVEVVVLHHLIEEAEEVGDHQVADVQPVHVGPSSRTQRPSPNSTNLSFPVNLFGVFGIWQHYHS